MTFTNEHPAFHKANAWSHQLFTGIRMLSQSLAMTALIGLGVSLSTVGSYAQDTLTSTKRAFDKHIWTATEYGAERTALWAREDGASGFLIRAQAGYSTDLLMRETDYRGFVLSGTVRHQSSNSQNLRDLSSGDFWSQPASSLHALSCLNDCVFYIEPNGSWTRIKNTAVNKHQAKFIALGEMPWMDAPNTGGTVKLAHVWGDPTDAKPSGFFLFFKEGFPGFPHIHTNDYDGVVLQGKPKHWELGERDVTGAVSGSYLSQSGGVAHDDSCLPGEDCITYFRFHGRFDISPATAQ